MKAFRPKLVSGEQGVTLVELLVYIAIVGIVMGAIYTTFKRQQDSYMVQERLAIMQQNLRGAMYMLASELQMAGYYTAYDPLAFPFPLDWDGDFINETIRPLIFGGNLNPDTIVIVKASGDAIRVLNDTDGDNIPEVLPSDDNAAEGSNQIILPNIGLDWDGDAVNEFDVATRPYGVIVKGDLTRAEFFRVTSIAGTTLTVTTAGSGTLKEPYFPTPGSETSDLIARVDVIVYTLDTGTNRLMRQNLGDGTGNQIVAENISDLQLQYAVVDAVNGEDWVTKSAEVLTGQKADGQPWDERDVRRIQVTIEGTATVPGFDPKVRNLTSTVKVRNMGMDSL